MNTEEIKVSDEELLSRINDLNRENCEHELQIALNKKAICYLDDQRRRLALKPLHVQRNLQGEIIK
jgi:hypothetical protein